MQTSAGPLICACDQTQECWLGNTETVTPPPSSIFSPPATQII